jgi:hypothetical protein
MALTDTAIRRTKPDNRPYKLYDRDGLFLLVNPGGGWTRNWARRTLAGKLLRNR